MMSLPAIALSDEVRQAIVEDWPVAIGTSGGKDSQAAAIAAVAFLRASGHKGDVILIHADLGRVEWEESLSVCETMSEKLDVPLHIVKRNKGDMMDRWLSRWESSKRRYEHLETVTIVPPWSTPSMRFCTSEMKTQPIVSFLKRLWKRPFLNVIGIRGDESPTRSRMPISEKKDDVLTWRPIFHYTKDDVFDVIAKAGMVPHKAYTHFGMTRVSCRFCIMSSIGDLKAASEQRETHDLLREMIDLELKSTFGFQGKSRWLADLKPDILRKDQRDRMQNAKRAAQIRQEAEGELPKHLLYVKGWPLALPNTKEALLLSETRKKLNDLMGFSSSYLEPGEIVERYQELMTENSRKAA